MSQLQLRLIYGSLGLAIVLIAIYFSHCPFFRPIFTLITAGIIGTAIWEYYQLAKAKGYEPLQKIGIGFAVLYVFAVFFKSQYEATSPLPTITLGCALVTGFLYDFKNGNNPIVNLALTVFGIVYLAIPLSCIIDITFTYEYPGLQDGRLWILYLLAVTKSTDIGAYVSGKLFGQNKLAPRISPKKTWEGAVGGFVAALIASLLFHFFSVRGIAMTLPFWHSIILGSLVSIFAQLGDLSESLLKRDAGIKDSNNLPGLGGMLDIVDSLVFSTPILCLYLKLF